MVRPPFERGSEYLATASIGHRRMNERFADPAFESCLGQLRLGAHNTELAAQKAFATTRSLQMKRRQQRHIYGPQSVADKQREEVEEVFKIS